MLRAMLISALAVLAACTPDAAKTAPPEAPPADAAETSFLGPLIAVSNTAMSITGDIMVEPGVWSSPKASRSRRNPEAREISPMC